MINQLTNIELFDKYVGTGYIDSYGEKYISSVLHTFRDRYKKVRREYIGLYKLNISYKNGYDMFMERKDYYSYMGLDYVFRAYVFDCDNDWELPVSEYVLSHISPEYCKSRMRSCEIELCFLKKNMRVLRNAMDVKKLERNKNG